jgi:aspartyl aminopeptidase
MYKKKIWPKYSNLDKIMKFADGYKSFLNNTKTERLAVEEIEKLLKQNGFKDINKLKNLRIGDKVYAINHNKNIIAFVIGKKPIIDGLRILCSHVDSPRLDLKQNPLYEDGDLALLDTHYYGGIKKYQWVTIPLALIGVVCKKMVMLLKSTLVIVIRIQCLVYMIY